MDACGQGQRGFFTCMRMAGQFEKIPNVADTTPIFATIGDFFYAKLSRAKNKIRMLFAMQWFSSK